MNFVISGRIDQPYGSAKTALLSVRNSWITFPEVGSPFVKLSFRDNLPVRNYLNGVDGDAI